MGILEQNEQTYFSIYFNYTLMAIFLQIIDFSIVNNDNILFRIFVNVLPLRLYYLHEE